MKHPFPAALVVLLIMIALLPDGCKNSDDAASPQPVSPCDAADTTSYGVGSCSFITPGAGDTFSVSGKYLTSSEFSGIQAGSGAGGFVFDTMMGGKRISAEFVAFRHRTTHIGIDEQLIVLNLTDSSKIPTAGDYAIVPSGASGGPRSVSGLYLYYVDSLGVFSLYEFANGVLSITSLDTCSKHVIGTFAGTLRGMPPDTMTTTPLSDGKFDLQYVPRVFAY